jgi:hypothetical protein
MCVGVEHSAWLYILFEGLQDINGIPLNLCFKPVE